MEYYQLKNEKIRKINPYSLNQLIRNGQDFLYKCRNRDDLHRKLMAICQYKNRHNLDLMARSYKAFQLKDLEQDMYLIEITFIKKES